MGNIAEKDALMKKMAVAEIETTKLIMTNQKSWKVS